MQSGREDTLEERYAIKFCFKLGKNATETYGMLGQSSHKIYSNNILNFQKSTTFLNACTTPQNSGNLLNAART